MHNLHNLDILFLGPSIFMTTKNPPWSPSPSMHPEMPCPSQESILFICFYYLVCVFVRACVCIRCEVLVEDRWQSWLLSSSNLFDTECLLFAATAARHDELKDSTVPLSCILPSMNARITDVWLYLVSMWVLGIWTPKILIIIEQYLYMLKFILRAQ